MCADELPKWAQAQLDEWANKTSKKGRPRSSQHARLIREVDALREKGWGVRAACKEIEAKYMATLNLTANSLYAMYQREKKLELGNKAAEAILSNDETRFSEAYNRLQIRHKKNKANKG